MSRSETRLRNTFPEWSEVFSDDQSVGAQVFDVFGEMFDDLITENNEAARNLILPTVRPEDLGLCYKVRLPETYTFTTDTDDISQKYTAPTVSGLVGSTYYAVSEVEDNSIRSFWRDAVPTRIGLGDTFSYSGKYLVSGTLINSPFQPLNTTGALDRVGPLFVRLSGSSQTFGTRYEDKMQWQGSIQLKGTDRYNNTITEELFPIYNDTYRTINSWKTLSGVSTWGIEDPDLSWLEIRPFSFQSPPYKSQYFTWASTSKERTPFFWQPTSGTNYTKLDTMFYSFESSLDRTFGFTELETRFSQELTTTLGTNPNIIDITEQPGSDYLWGVSSNRLYLYPATMKPTYSKKSINKKSEVSVGKIITSSDFVMSDETIDISYYWAFPEIGVAAYRVSLTDENNNKWVISSGSLVAWNSSTDYWVYGEPDFDRWLGHDYSVSFPATDMLYTITLEVRSTEGAITRDQRIIYSHPKLTPLAEYSLSGITTNPVVGVDVDYENHLVVLDSSNTVYEVDLHYDTMLLDYDNRTIYFREPYDEVIVDE